MTSSSSSQSRFCISKPFTALQQGIWLHNRPKQDVYQLLCDVFRMRREDKYKFEQHVQEGSIYAGGNAADELTNFRSFLHGAANLDDQRPADKKLLPAWWSLERLNECVGVATTDDNASVGYAVEKHDIQKFYAQANMPMQLRMFGEALDGTKVAGQSSLPMLQAMVAQEKQ